MILFTDEQCDVLGINTTTAEYALYSNGVDSIINLLNCKTNKFETWSKKQNLDVITIEALL